ncbi:hypothetical protein QQS21_002504 [Conoideocrella luteorostrata]|uniref:AMP-dependent synthetase/ligase domain-containing protein n=1 Tax=Conoideocrella luteorostrata TaxID=1105319 RepID=A0AAJ0FX79_9HYPO|nr:hypothetical protein QQS21_002504 [Conoideocrella luteorostrata]
MLWKWRLPCVSSRFEHQDNLADAISRYQPTILDITPSAASILQDSTVRSLQTLIPGAEHLSSDKARHWASSADLKITYDACESTSIATVCTLCLEEANEIKIRRGDGMNTWITDTRHGTTLVPIGNIGELVLEGPLIGTGYLDDAEKGAVTVINNPPWLIRGSGDSRHSDRTGKLVKTGDLVRHNNGGTLTFIARKTTEVKIHGHHVELGEVENHMVRLP